MTTIFLISTPKRDSSDEVFLLLTSSLPEHTPLSKPVPVPVLPHPLFKRDQTNLPPEADFHPKEKAV